MRRFSARRKKLKLTLGISIFIVLSIPLAIYGLLNIDNFDTSSEASNKIDRCSIRYIHVNPKSVVAGSTLRLEISANAPQGEVVQTLEVFNAAEEKILSQDYSDFSVSNVVETFTYTHGTDASEDKLNASLQTDQAAYPCVLADADSNTIQVVQQNLPPEFTSDPAADSEPGQAISLDDAYSYSVEAKDPEDDPITYAYSFTPGAAWLVDTEVSDGTDGKLQLDLEGTPDRPGSFFASVFIHDGYKNSLRSQTWVISVAQGENDSPVVTARYAGGPRFTQGQNIQLEWEVEDLNQIVRYIIYTATDPANRETWQRVTELGPDFTSYALPTSNLAPGSYRVIIEAVDNQSPAAVGIGVTEIFGIDQNPTDDGFNPGDDDTPEQPDDNEDTDDGVEIPEPQITGLRPENGSSLSNVRPTISATLMASENSSIDDDTIEIRLDDKDRTADLNISRLDDSEYTVILPLKEDLPGGEHQVTVSFKDSAGKEASRSWAFTIEQEEDETSDSTVAIFGFELPRTTAIIIGVGVAIVILALLLPWLLYLAWRDSDDDYPTYPSNSNSYSNDYRKTSPSYTQSSTNTSATQPSTPTYTPQVITPTSTKSTYTSTTDTASTNPTTPSSSLSTQTYSQTTTPATKADTQPVYTPPPLIQTPAPKQQVEDDKTMPSKVTIQSQPSSKPQTSNNESQKFTSGDIADIPNTGSIKEPQKPIINPDDIKPTDIKAPSAAPKLDTVLYRQDADSTTSQSQTKPKNDPYMPSATPENPQINRKPVTPTSPPPIEETSKAEDSVKQGTINTSQTDVKETPMKPNSTKMINQDEIAYPPKVDTPREQKSEIVKDDDSDEKAKPAKPRSTSIDSLEDLAKSLRSEN